MGASAATRGSSGPRAGQGEAIAPVLADTPVLADKLVARCDQCAALCCVALGFRRSSEFGFDKPAGTACRNLLDDFGCSIHSTLRADGFGGCSTFDCGGAGQRVVQHTSYGVDWRGEADAAAEMFAAFESMLGVHELLAYLVEVSARLATVRFGISRPGEHRASIPQLRQEAQTMAASLDRLADGTAQQVIAIDLDAWRARVGDLLDRASAEIRGALDGGRDPISGRRAARHPRAALRHADRSGIDLRDHRLRAADLRGAILIGADLSGCDLMAADLLGADLRDADLRGADLEGALFLTQAQLNSARGDAGTRIPAGPGRPALNRPAWWTR